MPWGSSKSNTVFHEGFASWTDLNGPEGGDIGNILWCPFQEGRLWVSSFTGDVFCSNNLQSGWRRCSPPLFPRKMINVLEAIPGAVPRIVVTGSGGGMFVTENSGVTWINVSNAFQGKPVQKVRHHPIYPGFALAACQTELFYTADGGISWLRYPSNFHFNTITAIEFSRSNPLTIYIADATGIQSRLLISEDGGQSFSVLLDATGKFWRIHTIIDVSDTKDVFLAGFGGLWGMACRRHSSGNTWEPLNKGLPFSKISCLTRDGTGKLWAGCDGNGLYRYDIASSFWISDDACSSRKFVKCIDSRGTSVAAGFGGAGVATRHQDKWSFHNKKLTARHVDVAVNPSGRQAALVNNELHTREDETIWQPVNELTYVQDLAANGTMMVAACLYDGIFLCSADNPGWANMNLPSPAAVRVCVSQNESTIYSVTMPPGQPISIYRKQTNQPNWHSVGSGINGPFEIYQMACACDGSWSVISTIAGLYWYDQEQQRWRLSEKNPAFEIRALASSTNEIKKLYAGSGEYLLVSTNAGQTFESGYVFHFPSNISAIWTTGNIIETIYVATNGGGMYASYFPGIWQTLIPQETGISIASLRTSDSNNLKLIVATEGISCCLVEVPGLKIKSMPDPQNSDLKRIYLRLSNPGPEIKVILHLIQKRQDMDPIYYAFRDGYLEPCPDPQPYSFTLESHTASPETYIGSIKGFPSACLIAGLLEEHGILPVGPIDGIFF